MSIKEKFEKTIYELETIPRIIEIRGGIVKIKKYAPYPDEIESLEGLNFENGLNLVDTKKLISPYRDSEFSVGIIGTEHFDNREKLDTLFLKYVKKPFPLNFEKISMNKAFDLINVELSCNMEYYLNHKNEMENDLNRKLNDFELKEVNLKKLEQELFYKQMYKLFGNKGVPESFDDILDETNDSQHNYEKACMVKDFRILYQMNSHYATAQRGNYYLVFEYAF